MSAYRQYLTTHHPDHVPSLREALGGLCTGAAVHAGQLRRPGSRALLLRHFSSITAENAMKPEALLDHAATLRQGDEMRAAVNLAKAQPFLAFARAHGMTLRFHVLVWHNQTPRWFFAQGFSAAEDAPLAAPEVILARLRRYIRDVMQGLNRDWADVISTWDVVNEAIEVTQGGEGGFRVRSLWYQALGTAFVLPAFEEARRHCAPGQQLFYNDYNSFEAQKQACILPLLEQLCEKGLIDGMGMQAHILPQWPTMEEFEAALRRYAALGLTIHLTEMDVHPMDASPVSQMHLAARYKGLMEILFRARGEGIPVESVTLWGLTDDCCWWSRPGQPCCPLLFDAQMQPKAAFFGMLGDEDIPSGGDEAAARAALAALGLPEK